jgi:hypothetical protein
LPLLPLRVKLLVQVVLEFVTTAPVRPPKIGVSCMKVSIVRSVSPLVVPTETVLTDLG